MVIALDVLGFPVAQVALDTNKQVTTSPLTGTKLKVGEFAPWLIPLTRHLYKGALPVFAATEVKLTVLPTHVGFWVVAMEMETGN
jgi:hypothetical protein